MTEEGEARQQAQQASVRSALENASTRIWCGNIASHVTSRTLKSVFSQYGYLLTDVAVFPARIGPLGYAFINFATLDEAVRAYTQLQNSVISSLTGSKQLKMRFKPIAVRAPAACRCWNGLGHAATAGSDTAASARTHVHAVQTSHASKLMQQLRG